MVRPKIAEGRTGKTVGKTLCEVLTAILALCLSYLLITFVLSSILGVHLPQIIYNPGPRHVGLSNPSYKGQGGQEVRPEQIQKILDAHPYDRRYERGVFDCSDMSIITARLLQEEYGYDTSVIGHDHYGHAWVYVWVDKNTAWAIEVTAELGFLRDSAGEVVGDQWWDIIFQGRWLEAKAWNLSLTGYKLYYPDDPDGYQAREWYQVEAGR
jgi:hypothetical protein